ncbi:hypothetical protein LCGC14_1219040 [marine sediment metagenome]|uniref:Uncharacterized protein n=1 Tax=marine sediment metagenome TaxID=412755 RepID=A0A0F9LBX2_9ZZZZ
MVRKKKLTMKGITSGKGMTIGAFIGGKLVSAKGKKRKKKKTDSVTKLIKEGYKLPK